MSFQQGSNGFGKKASKNVNKDFSRIADENINTIKEKGKQIAKENEQLTQNAKKTAIGCSIATLVIIAGIILSVLALIFFIFYIIFS